MTKSSKRRAAAESRTDPPAQTSPHSSSPTGGYDRSRVAMRAYELYMARGGADGADMEDWLIAEREFGHGDSESRGE